jgi:hypothetical protein
MSNRLLATFSVLRKATMATPTHLIIAVVISLVLLAGCVVPARLVSTAFAAQASVGIPFKGTIQEAVETHTVELPYMYVNGQGSGNATHLGLYTYSFQAKVRLPERIGEGLTATFTAANGDILYADGSGSGAPSGTPGYNLIKENFTITGGTERFAGATGSFYVERLINTDTKASTGWFEGTIVLRGRRPQN